MSDPSRMHYQPSNIQNQDPNLSRQYNNSMLGMNHSGMPMVQQQTQLMDRNIHMNPNPPNRPNELGVQLPDPQVNQVPIPHPNMPMQQQPQQTQPIMVQQQRQQQQPHQPQQQQMAQVQQPHQSQPPREVNTASLCRIGQEIVQEIIVKTTDVFQLLKIVQHPSGSQHNMEEIQARVQDLLNSINLLFKRLRLIYNKCNDDCAGMEYTLIEQSLIPMKDSNEYNKFDEKKSSEVMKASLEEYKETSEQIIQKNKHLKEVIDHVRHMIWEINTMLAMRKP